MVVLDVTIVNIAVPSAQNALGFSDDSRQWIVTAYALAFGSLLLIGGRIGDLFRRRRVFVSGLIDVAVAVAVASAIGGAARSIEVLIAARALQGVFGALLAPAALSFVTGFFGMNFGWMIDHIDTPGAVLLLAFTVPIATGVVA